MRCARRAAALALSERVEFVGSLPRAQALERLRSVDVLLMPSLWEGMPLAALEAMAMGVPVVASAVGGLKEIIEDGRSGFLIDDRDPGRYAAAVRGLRADPAQQRRHASPAPARSWLSGSPGRRRRRPTSTSIARRWPRHDRSLAQLRPADRPPFPRGRAALRRVLDIGAGQGADLLAAGAVQPGCALYAVEAYPPNVELLQGHGVEVVGLDLERDALPYEAGTIDVVIANQILEHTKEVFWIWHELARVLRLHGQLIRRRSQSRLRA